MEKNEIKNLAICCEHEIRKKFVPLADNRYPEEKMFNYNGIISADCITSTGGLYLAIASTLSRYYESEDTMNKIDNFLDKYDFIKDKSLDQIEDVKKILEEFKEITG